MSSKRLRASSREAFLRASGASLALGFIPGEMPSPASSEGISTRVWIDRLSTNGAVPKALNGLSYEKSKLSTNFFSVDNAHLIGCFKLLGPASLRIGGNAEDYTTWSDGGDGTTLGQVGPSDVENLARFLRETGWRVIYGINLGKNTPLSAAAEAKFVADTLGKTLSGFEIGNECDLYSRNRLRPATYTVSDFIDEWATYASAIRKVVPNARFTGPGSSGAYETWTKPFAMAESSQLYLLTQHFYVGIATRASSTMGAMLTTRKPLPGICSSMLELSKQAAIAGGYRLTEVGSFALGGVPNVSNAFGAALWTIDVLLVSALHGSTGVNFHGGGTGAYNPFYSPIADRNALVSEIRAPYYGMLFTSQIAPGPMYETRLQTPLDIAAYAVKGDDGIRYVAILNKDAVNNTTCSVDFGSDASHVGAMLLTSSGLDAITGHSFGGAEVAIDGSWSPMKETNLAVNRQSVKLLLPAASAVLLKVK